VDRNDQLASWEEANMKITQGEGGWRRKRKEKTTTKKTKDNT